MNISKSRKMKVIKSLSRDYGKYPTDGMAGDSVNFLDEEMLSNLIFNKVVNLKTYNNVGILLYALDSKTRNYK